jgi:Cu/Ag efflux pump CusA
MKRMAHPKKGPIIRFWKAVVTRVLAVGFRIPGAIFGAVVVAFFLALASVPFFGREFLPEFNEGSATVFVMPAPGTSLDESNRLGQIAERVLREVPEVQTIGRRTGRAEGDEHVQEVNSTEIEFELASSKRSRAQILADIRERLAEIPGVFTGVGQPGREILHPVAVVILSGLFSSTLLDLTILPLIFWKFSRNSIARLVPQAIKP